MCSENSCKVETAAGVPSFNAIVAAAVEVQGHSKTHMPSDPEHCEACRFAKMHVTRSLSSTPEQREASTATKVGDMVHLDLVGPTEPSYKHERYLLVARDDASGKPSCAGLVTKESGDTWNAFDAAVLFYER
jgi:hypothetical protein